MLGTAFRKSSQIKFTTDNYQTQKTPTLRICIQTGFPDRKGLGTAGFCTIGGLGNGNDLGTQNRPRNYKMLSMEHWVAASFYLGNIVIAADYSANRSTHLPWAGTSSTRDRNFLPSAARDAAINNPEGLSASDYLGENVPNPFQCFFTTVASPG